MRDGNASFLPEQVVSYLTRSLPMNIPSPLQPSSFPPAATIQEAAQLQQMKQRAEISISPAVHADVQSFPV